MKEPWAEEDDAAKGSCSNSMLRHSTNGASLDLETTIEMVSFSLFLCLSLCAGVRNLLCGRRWLEFAPGISALYTSQCGDPVESKLCMRLA